MIHFNLFFHHMWGDKKSSYYTKYEFKSKRLGLFFMYEKEGNTYVNGVALYKNLPIKYNFGIDLLLCRITLEMTIKKKLTDGGN